MQPCPVYIGVAGWSYPDWDGYVYTSQTGDHLAYLSKFVDCIEINSTFYRPPAISVVRSWLEKTAYKPTFFFTAKLHQDFTHQGKVDPQTVRQFKTGFAPLLGAGRLRFLLAQFRYDFADTPQTRGHLTNIVESLRDTFRIAIELRHRSWQEDSALEFLRSLGVTVCNLDYPIGRQSFQLRCCTIGSDGYFRLHGRNAAMWFSKAGRDQTYDYYYSRAELEGIRQRIMELGQALRSLTVIMNNHYRGSELANAIELKFLLTGARQLAPDALIRVYPALAQVAESDMVDPGRDLLTGV
jgi:uncharacterized protein YecE (DUF72 family)